ncbi:2-C-methyl-D-erythritol 4-phosphate cytidylyltransferase [Candidatus Williamhamiltonella defendens]|uniref:2-C-methyl-D-erythritol 4-phosphate cytidylyltransferase n=1 Tax=Candidatus Williamhamiltonella defendens TaxID=138072 RepID=UPI00130E39C6|nr:2-C-methyl-D-erythritol 4-phosphate cytidylyltransferase [Candidatus Hamiltonella defensa]
MNTYTSRSLQVMAIVPAAGIGSRMKTDCPKQYFSIRGKTILEYAVKPLLSHPCIEQIIIVIHPKDHFFQSTPLARHPKIRVAFGGKERANSVLAGLKYFGYINVHSKWILVHDAVRPCISDEDIEHLLSIAQHTEVGGILATPVRDTIKIAQADMTISFTPERAKLWHALTPQLFPFVLLKDCLSCALAEKKLVTDEASVLECYGYHPLLIQGRSDNIKITYPEDLKLAEFYLNEKDDESS